VEKTQRNGSSPPFPSFLLPSFFSFPLVVLALKVGRFFFLRRSFLCGITRPKGSPFQVTFFRNLPLTFFHACLLVFLHSFFGRTCLHLFLHSELGASLFSAFPFPLVFSTLGGFLFDEGACTSLPSPKSRPLNVLHTFPSGGPLNRSFFSSFWRVVFFERGPLVFDRYRFLNRAGCRSFFPSRFSSAQDRGRVFFFP